VHGITNAKTMRPATRMLWLDLTRKCQLQCSHCYNASGPQGAHGGMTLQDWLSVLDQAAAHGVSAVQFIGGEPTMHPGFADLVDHALTLGLKVEVFSNLVHVSNECWSLFRRKGLSLATSYYADQAEAHNRITARPSHARTRTNIEKAVQFGIPLRVGIIDGGEGQRVSETRRDLEGLGVTRIGVDHVRPFGRGARDQAPDPANLCGRCGIGKAAIDPNGDVSPCVFSGHVRVANVKTTPLATILDSTAMADANQTIRAAVRADSQEKGKCYPDATPCSPAQPPCDPYMGLPPACNPDDGECGPGVPSGHCNPRR